MDFFSTSKSSLLVLGLDGVVQALVRTLTIMFVVKKKPDGFRYLEHGAFYAIWVLAGSMLASAFFEIPEWVIGLSGAVIIGLSVLSSIAKEKMD